MYKIKYTGIACLMLLVCSFMSINPVCAHENDINLSVKLGTFFDVNFPNYDQKTDGCDYTWNCVYDFDHLTKYIDTQGNISFKTLQKGKTIMIAQLTEHNNRTGQNKIVKTVSYTITVK